MFPLRDVYLTMRLNSLLITVNYKLATHQQKTEQNVVLICTLSHTSGIQTNAGVMLIALTRWQTKRMSLLAKLLSNHYNREARGAMYDGWVIYKTV